MKKQKGITLIALIVTIIVLLILAGITVATLTGDNGLLTKAGSAKEKSIKAEGLEKIKVEVLGSYNKNDEIDIDKLRENLQKIEGITTNKDEAITESTAIKFPMIVKIKGNEYLIKSNGEVVIKNGIIACEVESDPAKYYGCYVTDYNSENDPGINASENQKWKIFMADEDNIYLIASNYIMRQYTGTKNGVGFDYDTTNKTPETAYYMSFGQTFSIHNQYNANTTTTDIPELLSKLNKQSIYHKWMNTEENQTKNFVSERSVAAMLDVENIWRGYNNEKYAQYAIGGPTLEMFCKAYNDSHTGDENKLKAIETNTENGCGYLIQKGELDPAVSAGDLAVESVNELVDRMLFLNNNRQYFWLASPCVKDRYNLYLMTAGSNYYSLNFISHTYFYRSDVCFRPLVCLKSDAYLVKNEGVENSYSLRID